jgi:hypothetical protein
MFNNSFFKKIYVSIASYMDEELYSTVEDLFANAAYPKRIFLSVFSQHQVHPELEEIFDNFNIENYEYNKADESRATGVGFARSVTQQSLSTKYDYYLQIDSHTRFIKHWDTKLISDYEMSESKWGKFIYSTYPPAYYYEPDGSVRIDYHGGYPPVSRVVKWVEPFYAKPEYCDYLEGPEGQYTGYFCAGLAFGKTKYFLDVPYDPYLYFQGEEQTMSIRFYDNGVKIVCPPRAYIAHNYGTDKRKRHWAFNQDTKAADDMSQQRLYEFFDNKIKKPYGVNNGANIKKWLEEHID